MLLFGEIMIKIKRIYQESSETDGYRVLVDRLWPRGISKEHAKIDLWIKQITPSDSLRRWYHDNPEKRDEFQQKYLLEIKKNIDSFNEIKKMISEKKTITLLTASKDPKPIHAIVLQQKLKN